MAIQGHEIRLLDSSKATVAVLWNPYGEFDAVACEISEEVEGEDTVTLTVALTDTFAYEAELTDDAATYYIRTINLRDAADIRTYHKMRHEIVHEAGQRAIQVTGERIWCHLRDRFVIQARKSWANIAISTVLAEILDLTGADASEFQLGTVASSSEVVDYFEAKWGETALSMIRRLCAKMGRELELDESTSPITLDFPAEIGDSASLARLRYGTNLRGVRRSQTFEDRVTRMFGVGGGDPPVTLSASSLAGGNDYIDSAQYDATENNFVGIYENTDVEDITNRIAAASCPDLSGTYTAGLCAGWTRIGTPTVSENTDATYIQYGTKSQKVIASDGQGIQVSFTASTDQRMVGWVNVYILSIDPAAVLVVEFTDGTVKWLNGEGLASTAVFATVERQGLEFSGASGVAKLYASGGACTFFADAAFVDNGDQFRKFVIGDMADVLYNEAAAELAKVDSDTAFVTYEVDGLDLFDLFPDDFADYEIDLGDTITVEDYELPNITASLRVTQRSWSVMRPEANRFQVGKLIRTTAMNNRDTRIALRQADVRSKTAQDRDQRAAGVVSDSAPVGALVVRFDQPIVSDSYNGFSWGAGTLRLGSDIEFPITSGSVSGLTASTDYYVYFDRDAPGSYFQATTDFFDTVGPKKALVAFVRTHGVGEAGCSIVRMDSAPQLSGDDLVTGTILANSCIVRSPSGGSSKVEMNSTGIMGVNSAGDTTFVLNAADGSAQFGKTGLSPATINSSGQLSVPGGIVATGIIADNITTGTLTVGVAAASDRLVAAWASKDIVLYRGGSAVADFGDITEAGYGVGVPGLRVEDPDGMVVVKRSGAVDGTPDLPTGMVCVVTRSTDEADTTAEVAFAAEIAAAARTSGDNGTCYGFLAAVDNDDGLANGFDANGIESNVEAVGYLCNQVTGSAAAANAYGLKTGTITAGGSGMAAGIRITNNISGGTTNYGIYNESVEDNYFAGPVGIKDSTPGFDLDVNGTFRVVSQAEFNSYAQLSNVTLAAPTDAIRLGSVDLTAGNTMPAVYTEGAGSVGSGTPAQDRTLAIQWRGTTYYLLASTTSS